MKRLVKLILLVALVLPCRLMAQKDGIRLVCPLNDAIVVPPPKNAIQFDPPDLCIVLASVPDTVVKACTGARGSNVLQV
jgi:hypothetical protein